MTTRVTVTACCDAGKKQVEVIIGDRTGIEPTILQDGETFDDVVYDERVITVREIEKS